MTEDKVFECEETVWLNMQLKNGQEGVLKLPTIPHLTIVEDEGKSEAIMIFPISVDESEMFKVGTDLLCVYFDMTNDPTPDRACGLVSLGYYSLRTHFRNCKIINMNPLTFVGPKPLFPVEAVEVHYTRPQRRYTE